MICSAKCIGAKSSGNGVGEISQNAVEKKAEHFDIAQQGSSSQKWLHPPGDLARQKKRQKKVSLGAARKGSLCKTQGLIGNLVVVGWILAKSGWVGGVNSGFC